MNLHFSFKEPNTEFQRMIKSKQMNHHPIKGGIIVNDYLIYNW